MPYEPKYYNICPCCGTEFANDDQDKTHNELRQEWVLAGMNFFFREPPEKWDPLEQLMKGRELMTY
jgi:hypothetical protein